MSAKKYVVIVDLALRDGSDRHVYGPYKDLAQAKALVFRLEEAEDEQVAEVTVEELKPCSIFTYAVKDAENARAEIDAEDNSLESNHG